MEVHIHCIDCGCKFVPGTMYQVRCLECIKKFVAKRTQDLIDLDGSIAKSNLSAKMFNEEIKEKRC